MRLPPESLSTTDNQGYKRLVDIASLPPDIEIESGWNALRCIDGRPATQHRIKTLLERGFCKPGDAEIAGDFVGR